MNALLDLSEHPHRRLNLLNGRWVLVSPHRARRPWQGQHDAPDLAPRAAYDASCYLCPGNARVGGQRNPPYTGCFVFNNDFAALQPAGGGQAAEDDLLQAAPARGECRVICFSPNHALTLPELPLPALRQLVDTWCEQSAALGQRWPWVQVFENKGAMMGCSNPHPHGQVWATDKLPDEVAAEDQHQRQWLGQRGSVLLADVLARELHSGERIVCASAHWVALVPWWATWPFETLLLPRDTVARLPELHAAQRDDLASVLRQLTTRYDNLFGCSFPYSMGWHGAPFDGRDATPWRLHAHFYPPLLRSTSVRKFMVGYELLAEAQRDLTPEQAAAMLRATSTVHYRAGATA